MILVSRFSVDDLHSHMQVNHENQILQILGRKRPDTSASGNCS